MDDCNNDDDGTIETVRASLRQPCAERDGEGREREEGQAKGRIISSAAHFELNVNWKREKLTAEEGTAAAKVIINTP